MSSSSGTRTSNDRQVVNERLQLAAEQLPDGVKPTLAPISSIMGQILMYGMSEGGETEPMEVRHTRRLGRPATTSDDSRRVASLFDGRRGAGPVPSVGESRRIT